MNRITTIFNDIKTQFKDRDGRKNLISKSLKYLPALLLFIAYIVLLAIDRHEFLSVLLMTIIVIIAFAVPAIKSLCSEKTVKRLKMCFIIGVPLIAFMVVEAFTRNDFWGFPGGVLITILNIVFYYILELLMLSITTRTDIAAISTIVIPSILGIANNISIQARDLPIYPWDILSARTAMSVVGNYKISFSPAFKLCIFIIVAVIIFAIQLNMRFLFKKRWLGIVPLITAIALFFGYVGIINSIFRTEENAAKHGFYPYLFNAKHLYTYNGTPITFIYTLKYLDVDPPAGYDADNIKNLYNSYKDAAKQDYENKANNKKPNIIVIMNEALSDLSVIGDIPVNKDYLPYIHSLMQSNSVLHGNTLVSVKGGNTPNSEFEFLSGGSMAFLPAESIPYQQFIDGTTPTLVAQMNTMGYRTIGMHNFYRDGWERDDIYDLFGFDEKYFLEDMKPIDDSELIRAYMSDSAMYKRIIDLYENNADDAPFFLFGVTMQNHGGYRNEQNKTFKPEIKTQYKHKYDSTDLLDNYLSLLYEADKAFEELVSYFSNVDEPTIILMFGDHQPADGVVMPIYAENSIKNTGTLESKVNRYKTPYIIWSNYDLNVDAETPSTVSLNYLGGIFMDIAGIPLTPFQLWQKELIKEYPTINAFSYTTASGKLNSAAGIQKVPMLNTFSQIQYNLMFDRKHTVKQFFLPVAP